jgi:signal recognition particle GTPase
MISIARTLILRGLRTHIAPAFVNSVAGSSIQLSSPCRKLSIFSALQDKVEDKKKQETIKQFKDQMKKMLEGPVYSLTAWSGELDEIMSSWKMKIPGSKSQPEVQRIMKFREILAKMTVEEKQNPDLLLKDEASLARIGAQSGATAEDVRMLLNQFSSLLVYQKWLRGRKEAGKRMPKDMEEMQKLITVDMKQDHMKKQRTRLRRF